MNTRNVVKITTGLMSLTLLALFVGIPDNGTQEVFAEISDNKPQITTEQKIDNVVVELTTPETIFAAESTPIGIRVYDERYNAGLSHTDFAFAVTDSQGKIVHKTTTAHGHTGVMNFYVTFTKADTYTVSVSASSLGPFMLGMQVPEKGQTHALISGDLSKFADDPIVNYGSRSVEFPVQVQNQEQTRILAGSEPGTSVQLTLKANNERVVAGQPTTIFLELLNAETGEKVTHPDALIKVKKGNFYASSSGDQPDFPLPLKGAYHGHLGLISFTSTFPSPGNYIIDVEVNSIPFSNLMFGEAPARFNVQVFENSEQSTFDIEGQEQPEDTINIVGLESPFFTPNVKEIKVGQSLTFDNIDANYHTVTSVEKGTINPDGMFDSGLLMAGDKFTETFNKSGTYEYFCSLHTNMKGTLIVS